MAKIFRTLNRKEQKYNKIQQKKISCYFSFEAILLVENVVRNYLIL
jgi:hypothetical protein